MWAPPDTDSLGTLCGRAALGRLASWAGSGFSCSATGCNPVAAVVCVPVGDPAPCDGTTHAVAVKNNAGLDGDPNAASLTYSLPDGSKQTTDVAATLDRIPRQPGKAGTTG
jgi:hypothetical protein